MTASGETVYNMALALGRNVRETGRLASPHREAHFGDVPLPRGHWSETEDQTLRLVVEGSTPNLRLCDLLPGRSAHSINTRCRVLQLKKPSPSREGTGVKWNPWAAAEDDKALRLRAGGKSDKEISQVLNRSSQAVTVRMDRINRKSR